MVWNRTAFVFRWYCFVLFSSLLLDDRAREIGWLVTALVLNSPEDIGSYVAKEIAEGIVRASSENRQFVLGCPGGRSARAVYQALAEEVRKRGIPLNHVSIAMMDEYARESQGGFTNVDPTAHYSCTRFAELEIGKLLNDAAGAGRELKSIRVPDARHPQEYEAWLREVGIDFFILASGATDGHIAFNPPGSPRESVTRVVEVALTTRIDNLGTFPEFKAVEDVPSYGVTVGIDTIASLSKKVTMIIHGRHKREAVKELLKRSAYDPTWPASIFYECANRELVVDIEANQA